MPSPLAKPDLELSPLSLLVLCDVANAPKGKRRFDRIDALLTGTTTRTDQGRLVPGPVTALERAGFIDVRRATRNRTRGTEPGWSIEVTDKGLETHRLLMTSLRELGAFAAR